MFDEVADVLIGAVPVDLGVPHMHVRRYGIKVWFGGDTASAPREHYEAQVIGAKEVPDAKVLAVEVGFHAEHPKLADNEAALAPLLACEAEWRAALGAEAVAGPFLGRDTWRRISEAWPDPDLDEAALDVGLRLAECITVLEPLRRR
ncbi:MAG TPA: hypothetical protein VM618_12405 [Acidimicrobiia bacterium]|nr:hypothetical protein [Acidimicrobiia bacterium]